MKGYNRCMALKIPVIVTLSARSGVCFAAPVHVYDRAGLPFYHRREAQHRASMSHLGAAVKTPAAVVADFAMCKNRDRHVLSGNAVSSADPRGPCLTHRNIINAHGSTATMRSNPAAVSQFQFRTTP